MREIKFRAWDKKNKRMTTEGFHHSRLSMCLRGNLFYKDNYDNTELRQYVQDNFILMQYTGLKDKIGKEIYEGDILKLYIDEVDEYSIAEVFFNDCCFNLIDRTDLIDNEPFEIGLNITNEIEVIGNVHENPGLLK
jgi:uncharacterized phage protein (TIGR01671 family)